MALPKGRAAAVAGATILGTLICLPAPAAAATTTTNNLALAAGSLSISAMSASSTFPGSPNVTAGTASGAMDQANWTDATGLGLGWNGTVSTTDFVDNGAWTPASTPALSSTASGGYTGGVAQAYLTVTVGLGGTTLTTPVTWTDQEGAGATASSGSATCTNGSACAISNGVTITFASGSTYANGTSYSARSGRLAASALSLTTGSATGPTPQGATLGGGNLPSFTNNGSTVTGGGPTTQGTAVKFVTAAVLTGIGTFQLAPGLTITWDANNTWAATYSATASYTINSGP